MERCSSCSVYSQSLFQHWDSSKSRPLHPKKSLCNECIKGRVVTMLGKDHHLCLICSGTFTEYVEQGGCLPRTLNKDARLSRPLFAEISPTKPHITASPFKASLKLPSLPSTAVPQVRKENTFSFSSETLPVNLSLLEGDRGDQGHSPFRDLTATHHSGLTPSPVNPDRPPSTEIPGVLKHTGPMKKLLEKALRGGSPGDFAFYQQATYAGNLGFFQGPQV